MVLEDLEAELKRVRRMIEALESLLDDEEKEGTE